MNTNLGLLGKKLGNTQIFDEDGLVTRVTAVEAGPCVVVGKRTPDKHGYAALELGFGARTAKHVNKPEAGHFASVGKQAKTDIVAPSLVREFRVPAEEIDNFEVGQQLRAQDVFSEGQFVDVSGVSKGRGFTGVMRRHNFHGAGSDSHGTHEARRHGGSIGMNMTPGRTLPGQRMPGQHGNRSVSILNLRVAKVVDDVLLIEGSVPGGRNGLLTVKSAVKKARPAKD